MVLRHWEPWLSSVLCIMPSLCLLLVYMFKNFFQIKGINRTVSMTTTCAANMSLLTVVESGDKEELAQKLERSGSKELCERNTQNHNALDLAALLGRQELLEALLDGGADINAANKSGYTALHYGAAWGQLECVQILVERGAESACQTRYKETPRDIAKRYGQQNCLDYLKVHEECKKLKRRVNLRRTTLSETEKISGRWNKDDKSKVTALCNEKSEWLSKVRRDSTIEEVQQQIEDFDQKMEPYLAKLDA